MAETTVQAIGASGVQAAAPIGADQAKKPIKIAVFNLDTTGFDDKIASTIAMLVAGRLSRWDFFDVITYKDFQKMFDFERGKQLSGCTDESCLAEIGGAMGVDIIVTGNIGLLGSVYVVTLQMINVRKAKIEGRSQFRLNVGQESSFVEQTDTAVEHMALPIVERHEVRPPLADRLRAAWDVVSEKKYRILTWTGAAVSVGSLAFGGVRFYQAKEGEKQYASRVDDLRASGRIVGDVRSYRFADEVAKAEIKPKLDAIRLDAEDKQRQAIIGFVGAGVFLGLSGLCYWLDHRKANEPLSAVVTSVVPISGGAMLGVSGSF